MKEEMIHISLVRDKEPEVERGKKLTSSKKQIDRGVQPNTGKMLLLLLLVLISMLLNFIYNQFFSFNFNDVSPYLQFHPQYMEDFLNKLFSLHLQVTPYIYHGRIAFDYYTIFWTYVEILCVSCALAASGAAYQAVFNNPMASPDILGVTAAASFGCIYAKTTLWFGWTGAFAFGEIMGLLTIGFVLLVSRLVDRKHPSVMTILLSGMILNQLFNSFITAIASGVLFQNSDEDSAVDTINMITQTRLDGFNLVIFIIVPIGVVLLLLCSWKMNALAFGDEEARGMGVNPGRLRLIIIVTATLLTVTVVAQCGQIGFVGLVAPHIARKIVGNNYRSLIPAAMLVGCLFVLLAYFVYSFFDADIGTMTTLVGVPYFISILIKQRNTAVAK